LTFAQVFDVRFHSSCCEMRLKEWLHERTSRCVHGRANDIMSVRTNERASGRAIKGIECSRSSFLARKCCGFQSYLSMCLCACVFVVTTGPAPVPRDGA
jgi:hypothetical protein